MLSQSRKRECMSYWKNWLNYTKILSTLSLAHWLSLVTNRISLFLSFFWLLNEFTLALQMHSPDLP